MKFKQTKIGFGPAKVIVGWELVLSHKETHKVATAGAAAATLPGIPSKVRAAVALIAAGLVTICKIGGHDGVRIIHSLASAGTPIVLPR